MFCFDPTVGWSTLVQLFGFVGAIWAAIYQLGKQRQLQIEKHKVDLQLHTYEKVAANMEGASPTGIATTVDIIFLALVKARGSLDQTGQYVPPPFHPEDVHVEFARMHANLWKVVAAIEKYEVVAPNLSLFREALAKKVRELGDAYTPLIQWLHFVLLSEKGITNPSNLIVLRGADEVAMDRLVKDFKNVAYDIAGFLYDIQIELQNTLLSQFFDRELSTRKPAGDDTLVLTSKDPRMLEKVQKYVHG